MSGKRKIKTADVPRPLLLPKELQNLPAPEQRLLAKLLAAPLRRTPGGKPVGTMRKTAFFLRMLGVPPGEAMRMAGFRRSSVLNYGHKRQEVFDRPLYNYFNFDEVEKLTPHYLVDRMVSVIEGGADKDKIAAGRLIADLRKWIRSFGGDTYVSNTMQVAVRVEAPRLCPDCNSRLRLTCDHCNKTFSALPAPPVKKIEAGQAVEVEDAGPEPTLPPGIPVRG